MRQPLLSVENRFAHNLLIAAICIGLTWLSGCGSKEPASPAAKTGAATHPTEGKERPVKEKGPTASDILNRMIDTYHKAATYADEGRIQLTAEADGEKIIDQTYSFSFTLERPNKVRAMAYLGMLVCDGKEFFAAIENLRGQVVLRPAPETLTMKNLFADRLLAMSMNQGVAGTLPQALFLLADDPLKRLLEGADEPELLEPGEIAGHKHFRMRIRRPDGDATLWIDQKTLLLKRVVLPTEMLREDISRSRPVDRVSLVADFVNARLNEKIDPTAFVYEVPQGAQVVKVLIPPHTSQLLGKPVPNFKFTDADGKPVTPETIAGKVTLFDFWATWCGPCRHALPELEKLREKYKNNPKVALYAVSVDQPQVKNDEIAKLLSNLKVQVPFLRDTDREADAFRYEGRIPTSYVIGTNGLLQDFLVGANPAKLAEWPDKIDQLLAGKNIFEKPLKVYEDEMHRYVAMVEKDYGPEVSGGSASTVGVDAGDRNGMETSVALPETKIAERTQPSTLKLTPLWKCTEVRSPGNMIVLEEGSGAARLVVVEGWKGIAEVGLDGKLIARHPLKIEESEVIGNLRTAVDYDGRRYIAAFMATQQRCHLFDENWRPVLSYPEDALKKPHSGIADVQLGCLAGDDKLKMYISYLGVVGIQEASLQGKRLWSNRSVANVGALAFTGPDAKGRRNLVCTNTAGPLALFNAQGERQGEISIPGETLHWIAGADLLHTKTPAWCGISSPRIGENVAVGFEIAGKELWRYRLPDGVPPPMELIVAGHVTPNGPGQWILPGADGSVHILAPDGKPVDKFFSGVTLQGIATARINGQPTLIISSPDCIEAWKVEQ